jgi:molybdopterin molybdotransferase
VKTEVAHVRDADRAMRVDFERARALMLAAVEARSSEMVPLHEAGDRVVAAILLADADIVPYARSGMDGFALRAADARGADAAPVVLPVAPTGVRAIATGAPLPEGTDCVVPIECVVDRGDSIVLRAPLRPGDHVFPPGDDAKRGEVLVRPGDAMTAGRAALLAAAGHATVRVVRRPRVAIACTSDTVVAAMLAVAVVRDGAAVVSSDSPGSSDLIVASGRDAAAFETHFAFRSVALRPAKQTGFGRLGGTPIVVLPEDPAAAFVAYRTLVRGLVRKLAGRSDPYPRAILAALDGTIRAKPERHHVIFARLANEGGVFRVTPLENQCSSLVRTAADANALIVVPPGTDDLSSGTMVPVEVVD